QAGTVPAPALARRPCVAQRAGRPDHAGNPLAAHCLGGGAPRTLSAYGATRRSAFDDVQTIVPGAATRASGALAGTRLFREAPTESARVPFATPTPRRRS